MIFLLFQSCPTIILVLLGHFYGLSSNFFIFCIFFTGDLSLFQNPVGANRRFDETASPYKKKKKERGAGEKDRPGLTDFAPGFYQRALSVQFVE
jgi:hypothetical protein